MRVATFVLGFALLVAGGLSEASETIQGPSAHRAAAVLADGVIPSPSAQLAQLESDRSLSPSAMLYVRDLGVRGGLGGAMSFVPSQNAAPSLRGHSIFGERGPNAAGHYDPARIPLPATRSIEDHLLTGFIALMLIAYQLRRKHRFLRPHQFST